jgi:hypothetical protein
MPFVPVVNAVEVTVKYLYRQQICENVLGFLDNDGLPTTDDLINLLSLLQGWLNDEYMPFLSDDVVGLALHARSLTTVSSPVADSAFTTTGGIAVPGDPNNVTLAVSFRTGIPGRSFRGRSYIIGVPSDQIAENTVSPTFLSNMLTAYAALPPILGTMWSHAVLSRFTGGAPRVSGVASPVTSYLFTDNIVDSQRRRLPGRGR